MSGDATFAGTHYQSRVIALVYTHMLAQARLGWFEFFDDTPAAVSGESGGPGDDLRIEFQGAPPVEVQAKHGMTAGAKLNEVLARIAGATPTQEHVVLAMNRASSKKLYTDFARDLDRIRSGRTDGLAADTEELRRKLGARADVLKRMFVLSLDVDEPRDPEWKGMAALLTHALVDPKDVPAALAVLADDGSKLCSKRLRRTRKELVDLLGAAQIKVKPPAKEERWHRELDFTSRLLKDVRNEAALSILEELERTLSAQTVDPPIRYRLFQQKAAALLRLNRLRESLAYAQRAIDLDGSRSEAHQIAAIALLMTGDTSAARKSAERATDVGPHDQQAWSVAAKVAAATGSERPHPPPDVAVSSRFRQQLADISATEGAWADVLIVSSEILATGSREPETLFLRGMALANLAEVDASRRREHAAEAERLANEILDALRQDHPLAIQALGIRSEALRMLGRVEEASADAALALARAGDDPEAIRRRATFLHAAGDLRGAVSVLQHPAVQADIGALALRARLFAESGRRDEAKTDLAKVLERLPTEPPNEPLCFSAVDAAVVLKDADLAETAFSYAPKRVTNAGYRELIKARIAILRGDFDRGVELLQALAREGGTRRDDLLIELAVRQQRAGRHQDAVRSFEEVGVAAIPVDLLANYATALVGSEALVGAKSLLDYAAKVPGPLPDWAVRLAAHLALLQEDPDAAIAALTELVARGGIVDTAVRVNLAAALIEVDRQKDANVHLDLLAAAPSLTAEEGVRTSLLLKAVGRTKDAISVAFRSLRRWPQSPQIHRTLVSVAMSSTSNYSAPDVVGSGVSVCLQDSTGTSRWWTIVDSDDVDPLRGEMCLGDAAAFGLIGQGVGAVLTQNEGTWNQRQQTIVEIVPAEFHAVHDSMNNFADRFPREPFFVTSFSVGDLSSVRDLAPLIGSVEARRRHAEHVLRLYGLNVFPLGFVAQALGVSIAVVMAEVSAAEDGKQPQLVVEWPDGEGRAESIAAAISAQTIVLTRSSLQTAHDLELLPVLPKAFSVVVPRTLLRELHLELRNAEEEATRGRSTLGSGPTGIVLQEVAPRHSALVQTAASIRIQLEWATRNARSAPRPLESIQQDEQATEQLRNLVGYSSADAIDLVRHRSAKLYADDLGLRRLFPRGEKRSFSTVALLAALRSRGLIEEERYTSLTLMLIARRHAFFPPSHQLLLGALREHGEFARAKLRRVFALLGSPGINLADSAKVVGDVVRRTELSPIRAGSLDRIVDLSLEAMSHAWPPALCAQAVRAAVAESCPLLPHVVRQVERLSARFLVQSLTVRTGP